MLFRVLKKKNDCRWISGDYRELWHIKNASCTACRAHKVASSNVVTNSAVDVSRRKNPWKRSSMSFIERACIWKWLSGCIFKRNFCAFFSWISAMLNHQQQNKYFIYAFWRVSRCFYDGWTSELPSNSEQGFLCSSGGCEGELHNIALSIRYFPFSSISLQHT